MSLFFAFGLVYFRPYFSFSFPFGWTPQRVRIPMTMVALVVVSGDCSWRSKHTTTMYVLDTRTHKSLAIARATANAETCLYKQHQLFQMIQVNVPEFFFFCFSVVVGGLVACCTAPMIVEMKLEIVLPGRMRHGTRRSHSLTLHACARRTCMYLFEQRKETANITLTQQQQQHRQHQVRGRMRLLSSV